ncbi:hypothetical protein WDU94_010035 [Cyamophila willieti]
MTKLQTKSKVNKFTRGVPLNPCCSHTQTNAIIVAAGNENRTIPKRNTPLSQAVTAGNENRTVPKRNTPLSQAVTAGNENRTVPKRNTPLSQAVTAGNENRIASKRNSPLSQAVSIMDMEDTEDDHYASDEESDISFTPVNNKKKRNQRFHLKFQQFFKYSYTLTVYTQLAASPLGATEPFYGILVGNEEIGNIFKRLFSNMTATAKREKETRNGYDADGVTRAVFVKVDERRRGQHGEEGDGGGGGGGDVVGDVSKSLMN